MDFKAKRYYFPQIAQAHWSKREQSATLSLLVNSQMQSETYVKDIRKNTFVSNVRFCKKQKMVEKFKKLLATFGELSRLKNSFAQWLAEEKNESRLHSQNTQLDTFGRFKDQKMKLSFLRQNLMQQLIYQKHQHNQLKSSVKRERDEVGRLQERVDLLVEKLLRLEALCGIN